MSRVEFLHAKQIAVQLLEEENVGRLFRDELTRRGVDASRIVFDHADACRRIMQASYLSRVESIERQHDICGETQGGDIWIVRGLPFEDQVETLLHEAMHDSVSISRPTRSGEKKMLSEELEHDIMYRFLR